MTSDVNINNTETDFDFNQDMSLHGEAVKRAGQSELDDILPAFDPSLFEKKDEFPTPQPEVIDKDTMVKVEELNQNDERLSVWADIPLQAVGSVRDAANAFKDLPIDMGVFFATADPLEWVGLAEPKPGEAEEEARIAAKGEAIKQAFDLPEVSKSDRASLQIMRSIGQFMVPYAGVAKVQLAKNVQRGGAISSAMINSAITDFAFFDDEEARVAQVAKDLGVDNFVVNWLAGDEDDSAMEGHIKRTVESAGLGLVAEGLVRGLKASRQIIVGKRKAAERAAQAAPRSESIKKTKETVQTLGADGRKTKIDLGDFRPNQERIDIETQRRLADAVGTTAQDIKTGDAFKSLGLGKTRDRLNSFTLVEEKAFNDFTQNAADHAFRLQNGDKAARADFISDFVDVLEINGKVLDATQDIARAQGFRSQGTEAISAINELRDVIASASDDNIDEVMKAMSGLTDAAEVRAFVSNMSKDAKKIKAEKLSIKEFTDQWFMNSILSSPETLLADTVSNVAFTAWNKVIEKPLAAGIGGVRTMLGGNADRVRIQEGAVFIGSVLNDSADFARMLNRGYKTGGFKGSMAALKEGLDQTKVDTASRFGKHRSRKFLTQAQIDTIPPYLQGTAKFMNNTATFPTLFMQGKDDVVKGMLYRSGVKERATRRALNEGLRFGTAEFKERVAKLSVSPIDDIANNLDSLGGKAARQFDEALKVIGDDARITLQIQRGAIKEGRKLTFTDPASDLAQGITQAADAVPGGRFVVPFVATIDNLTRRSLDRSVLALLSSDVRATLKRGGAEADEVVARMVAGTTLMGAAYVGAMNGKVTGDGPKSHHLRNKLTDLGWRPRSIHINGQYINLSRTLGPLALMYQIPANIAEIYMFNDNEVSPDVEKDITDLLTITSSGIAKTIVTQSWASGLSQLFATLDSQDEDAAKRMINNIAASMAVPNAINYIGNELDPILQQTDGLLESIRDRAGMDVRPKRDVFGDPVSRDRALSTFFPATRHGPRKDDIPQWKVDMYNDGAYPAKPSKRVSVNLAGRNIASNIELTVEEHERMLELIGKSGIKKAMQNLYESGYIKMFPGVKVVDGKHKSRAEFAKGLYAEARNAAVQQLIAENPELVKRAVDVAIFERTDPGLDPLSKRIGELLAQ